MKHLRRRLLHNEPMKGVVFVITMTAIVALFVGSINQEHITFASKGEYITFATNKGINVQTSTTQDQGCESAGGTSGITNACTATFTPGSTPTSVTFSCQAINQEHPALFDCSGDNISFSSASCTSNPTVSASCTTNTGVQLTSCTQVAPIRGERDFTCTLTEPGTGISSSGGITESDGR